MSVDVVGQATCPAPDQVAARLVGLVPQGDPGSLRDTARIDAGADGLRITLKRSDGRTVGDRVVVGAHSCADLAETAAVLIAAWRTEIVAMESTAVTPSPPAPRRLRGELGVGAGGTLSRGATRPVGMVTLGLRSVSSPWGLRLGFAVDGSREEPLGPGQVRWARPQAAVGPDYRFMTRWGALDLYGAVAIGWARVQGQGLNESRSGSAWVLGAQGGLRFSLRVAGSLGPWADLGMSLWPGRTEAYQGPDGATAVLPRFAAILTLGGSLTR